MHRLRNYLLALLVFAASGAATAWLWQHERNNAELDRRAELDFSLREIASSIEQRLASYEQVLQGVRGFVSATRQLESRQLQTYLETLQLGTDYVGLEEISVVSVTPANEGPYADAQLRTAMDAARDSGRLTMTDKRTDTASGDLSQVSVLLFLPLYQGGAIPPTLAARRDGLQGWVMAPVRISGLMASLYGQRALRNEVRVHDGVEMTPQSLMFGSTLAATTGTGDHSEATEYLVLAGQTWALSTRARSNGLSPSIKDSSLVIALGGGGMTLLMTLIAWMLVTRRERALALATDMTAELREVKDRLELILDTSPDGVVLSRWKGGIVTDVNLRFTSLTQFEREDIVGHLVTDIGLWSDPQALQKFIAIVRAKGECENFEAEFRLKDGSLVVCLVSGKKFLIGGVPHLLSIARDISERKQIELRMEHMAQHDPLTELPNRALFFDRLQQELEHAKRDGTRLALMFIDLDHFKDVNDTWGHAVGDLLLQKVATRISACLRQSDTVGRIGGDEFVVLLPLIRDDGDVLGVAMKIRQALDQVFNLRDDLSLHISCSNGIATFPEHGSDEIELSKNADAAMYLAKQSGGNRVEIYSPAP